MNLLTTLGISSVNGMASSSESSAAACTDYQFPDDDCSLGIAENDFQSDIQIFPNPVTDVLQIKTSDTITEINIYDTNGRLVKKTQNKPSIDTGELQSGLYLLRVQGQQKTYTSKTIKQ